VIVSTISSEWPSLDDLEEIAEEQLKEFTGELFRACVKLSPVLTGEYSASWRVSFNEARTDITTGGTAASPIRGASFRWPSGFQLGDEIVVSNNVPYAELIEYGWSNQAPFGVLNVALAGLG